MLSKINYAVYINASLHYEAASLSKRRKGAILSGSPRHFGMQESELLKPL
jgi:hypothetical protein